MNPFFPYVLALLVATVTWILWSRCRVAVRAEFIRQYTFPKGLYEKLRKKRPELVARDCELVASGLRQFSLAYNKSKGKPISMPSQVTDDLWHELILYTKAHELFCRRAFGRFLPQAVVLGDANSHDKGLRLCWWHACREQGINPRNPTRLPLLFALDAKLHIENGFTYQLDCGATDKTGIKGRIIHCGGDFASSCAGDGASSCSGDSGCSGGCGGD